jgi:TatA/E family protein of Tat protein translocase
MLGLGYQELLVILVIVLILFGANRLPALAKSLGSSLKEFKDGVDEGKRGNSGSGNETAKDMKAAAPVLPSCPVCQSSLAADWHPLPNRRLVARYRWALGTLLTAGLIGCCLWLVATNAPAYQFLVRLYVDQHFLKQTLREWGMLGPVIFIVLQALQVVIAPIPGELTGVLGGFLFGQWLGLAYSTVGLTQGSVAAFGVGRWFGAHYVRNLVGQETWTKMSFIVETEGTILCFIVYLIPGFPKDIVCYLFGLSPIPFWVFAVTSTLGRIPGTWALSAQGTKVASGQYLELLLFTALVAAVAIPLYYYRSAILAWFRTRRSITR